MVLVVMTTTKNTYIFRALTMCHGNMDSGFLATQPSEVAMRTLKFTEVKELVRVHTASKW